MQNHPNQRRKYVLLLLLVLCCAAVAATGTYAAYSTSGYVKRVIAAQSAKSNNALRFSSNYLTETSSGNRLVSVTNAGTSVIVGITVCNYPQDDATLSMQIPSPTPFPSRFTVMTATRLQTVELRWASLNPPTR